MIIDSYYDSGSVTKKYGMLDYLAALLLCAGAVGYTFSENTGSRKPDSSYKNSREGMKDKNMDIGEKEVHHNYDKVFIEMSPRNFGIFLLFISVCCDAFLPNLQLQLMKHHHHHDHHHDREIISDKVDGDRDSVVEPRLVKYDDKKSSTEGGGGDSVQSLMVNTNGERAKRHAYTKKPLSQI
jgi:hypothetical protein